MPVNIKTAFSWQGEKSQKKPILLTPCSWTCSLQNWERINFCWLSSQSAVLSYGSMSKCTHRDTLLKKPETSYQVDPTGMRQSGI